MTPVRDLSAFQTERLSAERLRAQHLDVFCRMHANETVMAWMGGARSREETIAYMGRNLSHWDEYGYGIWLLRDRATGTFAGRGGLRNAVFDARPEIEVAYALLPEFWGQGLATEYARALVGIGHDDLGSSELIAITRPDNAASRRVLEKTGFRYERDVLHQDATHWLFRHHADESATANGDA
jgi:ribosomal-protein-alanine N-acetyltransferase